MEEIMQGPGYPDEERFNKEVKDIVVNSNKTLMKNKT